ncbi:MAG: TonB-dependent receptor [Thermoanaerobaculia bacterium]
MTRTRLLCFLVISLFLLSGSLFAQGTTSALTGQVQMDDNPLPGVTVTISSPNLQGTRTAVTDVNGNYLFPSLPPGDYTVKFEMEGMQAVTKTLRVGLARTERANATMKLSAIAEAITVTAAAPAVLETTEVQTNFDSETIENLPVARTLQGAVQLAPGVTATGPGGAAVVGGGYAYDTLYLINGAVANENVRGQTDNLFIEDAIQETSVMTGSISAEYGRFTGGVVSAITKSGGNEFSGSFRDSFTNPSWDKTTPLGEENQESTLNQTYEATLGGRIVRDRLWFFGAGRQFEQDIPGFFTNSTMPRPTTIETDDRWEVKLTGQLTTNHSLVGSYLSYEVDQTPHCAFGCFELSTMDLDGRQLPRDMTTAQYNGVLSRNFLIEAAYSDRSLEFANSGGNYLTQNPNDPADLARGTVGWDFADSGAAWGAPVFCGVCDVESRTNEYYLGKASYYLSSAAAGTHNIVAGYENFSESRFSNNYQSGSNFMVYAYGVPPEREADGTLRPIIVAGDDLVYTPVPIKSRGSDFATESIFVNDKWDLGTRWSFNLGARYDKNDGVDSAGTPISKDDNISPRLGAIFDVRGDGKYRVNASYSKYVSRIQETVGGGGGGGNPWYVYYTYDGPQIGGIGTGMDSQAVLTQLFTWWMEQGGFEATDLIGFARVPGFNTAFDGNLLSPSVDEYTVGFGTQIGSQGMVRVDYVNRKWNDFYVLATSPHDQVENPIVAGAFLDNVLTRNANSADNLERDYSSIQLQASYRFTPRFNLGGNYTWSEAKGNTVGESTGLGPFGDQIGSYVEYKAFDRHNPSGFLPNDQTHKARLWLSYDLPLAAAGNLNFSVLERFDSGTPYSAVANVNPRAYVTNPGYASRPSGVAYYFSDRGEYRWDDLTATDLAINYEVPISRISLFLQGEVINVFDESAQINGSTSVSVIQAFNPFTETPVEGVNWRKNASFGQATVPTHYQLPMTYRFSAGIRF